MLNADSGRPLTPGLRRQTKRATYGPHVSFAGFGVNGSGKRIQPALRREDLMPTASGRMLSGAALSRGTQAKPRRSEENQGNAGRDHAV